MEPILQGVSAYVEVWSSNRTENYSKTFAQQLLDMGAKVSKTFNKQVTHVVFKEGHLATWRKAQKTGVKLVSVLWVEKCREAGAHVDESLFPAIYTNEGLPLLIKKHKCMQPKDFIEKTPENDKRLQKKLDMMAKELDVQKTATETDIPILLFEDDGSLAYSPTNKIKDQCSAMEKRIKDMKEKRENLSPTASQMSQISTLNSTQPGYGESLGVTSSASALLPEEHISDSLNSSFDIWGNCKYKNQKPASAESDIYVSTPASEHSLFSSSDQGNLTPKSSNRKHLNKKLILQRPLEDKLFAKERKSKVSLNLNQSGADTLTSALVSTKSSFLQEKDLSHTTLSPKIVQLEAAAVTTGNQSDSLVSNEDSINMHLGDINIPVDTRDCSVRYKIRGKPKREKYNMKLTTLALCKIGSENEFLLAMTTRNKSSDIEEASYEDFFSPSNLKKSEMHVRHFPLQVQQNSPSAPEVSCKRDFLSHKQDRLFEGSDKQCIAVSKKRKRTVKTSGVSTESDCKLTECSESTVSVTLNCTSGGVNTETAEALGSSPLNQLHQNGQKITCRTSVNSCPQATGKLLHSNENSKMQHHDALKMFVQLNSEMDYHVEGKQWLSETRLPEENTALMASDSLKSDKIGAVEPKEHPLTFPDSTNTEKSTGKKKEILLKKCSPSIENETSVCEATDGSCEVFNENKNKPCGESKKTGRIKKPTRTLVMTSMSSEKQCAIIQVMNKLGGFLFSDDVCETTTHVVTGSPRRTLNVMLGIARGCWIVCYEWVLWSLECGHWISEEPYELSANFPAAPICRLQRHLSSGKYQQDLFSSQPVMFISLASQPPCDKLRELVQLCGGKICKTLRQAKIYIGEYLGKKQPEIKYLSEKWILDSVTQHRICPLENYMFQQ
ncbi:microcephalin isoform X2 [Dermochelys coriacea]|uniref:microcephalin isoform X2 n=2 Tax=Dermochelys coriacea TaxID=27794 RepID=UPI0018E7225E|nr:microcephalin isoform X2 [Dermochelys coriacea]